MALPPRVYAEARDGSQFHLQVEVEKVVRLPHPSGDEAAAEVFGFKARVAGRVVHVFRGGAAVQPGDRVTFDVAAALEPRAIPGVHEMAWDQLRAARYLEVFLDGEPPDCGDVGILLPLVLDASSDAPVLPTTARANGSTAGPSLEPPGTLPPNLAELAEGLASVSRDRVFAASKAVRSLGSKAALLAGAIVGALDTRAVAEESVTIRNLLDALREIGPPAARPLIAALGADSRRLRRLAVKALDEAGQRAAVLIPHLVAVVRDRQAPAERRDWAAATLGGLHPLPEPMAQLLRAELTGGDDGGRRAAAAVLAGVGSPEAVAALAAALDDPAPQVRQETARALARGDFGPAAASARARLTGAVREYSLAHLAPDWAARSELFATVERSWPQAESLGFFSAALADESARAEACQVLARLGPEGLGVLRAALTDSATASAAARTLARADPGAVADLRSAAASADPAVRALAVRALGLAADRAPENLATVLAALRDEDAAVRAAAASALAMARLALGMDPPPEALLADPDPGVREQAVGILTNRGSAAAGGLRQFQTEMAKDPTLARRGASAPGLLRAWWCRRRVVHAAVRALTVAAARDPAAGVRAAALPALVAFLGPSALPDLCTALSDPDPGVRDRAVRQLADLGPAAAPAAPGLAAVLDQGDLGNWPETRHPRTTAQTAAEALYRLGLRAAGAGPQLARLLRHRTPEVRASAAFLLGVLGPAAAVRALSDLLGCLADPDPRVAARAVFALLVAGPAAAAGLTRTLDDPRPTVRQRAARALLASGRAGRRALSRLTELAEACPEEDNPFTDAALALTADPPPAAPAVTWNRDPIEGDRRFGWVLRVAEREADRALAGVRRGTGFCHQYWPEKAAILRDWFGIEWSSPAAMNPGTYFD
jgi:HEAT repeat protein